MIEPSDVPSDGRRSRWRITMVRALAAVAGCCAALSVQSGGAQAASPATTTAVRSTTRGYSPRALQRAYGVLPLLREGVDGRGETVVVPEGQSVPSPGARRPPPGVIPPQGSNIGQDLTAFDNRYHLPRVRLTISRALGYRGDPSLADQEEVLDAEMIHATAPAAKINIMLTGPRAFTHPDLGALLRAAAGRGDIVSLSLDECERCFSARQLRSLNRALDYARDRHVSVIAAAGDFGAASGRGDGGPSPTRGVGLPAASPLVTAVGGTRLTVHHDGAYESESVWNVDVGHGPHPSINDVFATGGGITARYPRPGYQHGLPVIGDHRGIPDVAATADLSSGIALVQVAPDGQQVTNLGGGTSASTPLWAAIAALADQDAHRQLGFLNQGLYRIGHSTMYHHAFHDITHGTNTVTLPSGKRIDGYRARPGWDPVTGWGSPNAQVLVPFLGKQVHPGDGRGL